MFGDLHVMERNIPRASFKKLQKSKSEAVHQLVFAVQQRNIPELENILLERSTPGNPLYQQWLTFEQVGEMTSNPQSAQAVLDWLFANDVKVTWQSAHQDYIKAEARISVWDRLLNANFYEFEDSSKKSSKQDKKAASVFKTVHRTEEYSLPTSLKPHISAVFNTVQTPPEYKPKYRMRDGSVHKALRTDLKITKSSSGDHELSTDGTVTISFLNSFYEIGDIKGSSLQQQSVFETSAEFYSPSDLTLFQQNNHLPKQTALHPFGYNTTDCNSNDCYEGNLDIQFMMGVSPGTVAVYWYNGGEDPFVDWITDVANSANPPLVNSISWGSVEQVSEL